MKYFVFLISTCFIFIRNASSEGTFQNNTHSSTTQKLIVSVSASSLCKKCHCDTDHKILDCTNILLKSWFNEDEFNTLQNGDVQFESIRLDHNNLEKVPIFPELSIKKIFLAYNKINSIEPGAFKNLLQLEVLDLSHNQLTSKTLTPAVFKGRFSPSNYEPLDKLKVLNLAYNELHTIDSDLFEHFPNLEELSLSGNIFQVIDYSSEIAIASVLSLKTLDLSYMELQTIPEYIFHSPREKLEKLILTGNLFKKIPDALSYSVNLKSLYLDENPLNNIEGENIFPRLKSLEVLSISFLKHTKQFGKGAFSKLENLKEFYATNNVFLSDIHPSAFARPIENETTFDYPPIEKLYLHNNNLSVLPKTLFERWDKINIIDIRMNPWKCDTDNDFLIHDLFPQILKSKPEITTKITCNTPLNYKNIEISEIYDKKKALRTLDRYGNHPENDGAVLVGILIGLIIGIPVAFTFILIYKRGCFGLIRRPTDYGGALYKRADFHDDI